MTPHYSDDWLTLYGGDCREVLASLPADSVDCVVTSPPYWGLRDYGTQGQLGLERTPEEYVANMVEVFREVRRVLKPSGTCWLNLGDSYIANIGSGQARGESDVISSANAYKASDEGRGGKGWRGLPGKNLVGIPWRVAFALQADGWYLRSDIIWAKPNPMPESVTDRPTKSHEYLFLLTKQARYYFDADAVREPHVRAWDERNGGNLEPGRDYASEQGNPISGGAGKRTAYPLPNPAGRNIRSVWTIATRPYPGAHFAVFPPELPERCIKAGSSERGVCPECGAPWERVVERKPLADNGMGVADTSQHKKFKGTGGPTVVLRTPTGHSLTKATREPVGWRPSCGGHYPAILEIEPATILDPFGGSGTVGMVANRLSRRAILIDLNPEYLKQQMKRNAQTPLGLDAA